MVNGTSVEEYTGSFPGAAVAAQFDTLVKPPPHTSIGGLTGRLITAVTNSRTFHFFSPR